MAEQRITIEIDEQGNISATTNGIKGETCLEELEALLGSLDDYASIKKTDEFFQQNTQRTPSSQQNKRT